MDQSIDRFAELKTYLRSQNKDPNVADLALNIPGLKIKQLEALRNAGIVHIGDLALMADDDLKYYTNGIGEYFYKVIKDYLQELGLTTDMLEKGSSRSGKLPPRTELWEKNHANNLRISKLRFALAPVIVELLKQAEIDADLSDVHQFVRKLLKQESNKCKP